MVGYLSAVMVLPFMLVFCTIILFYYLHWSFMSAMVLFAFTFVLNFYMGRRMARTQKEYMKRSDSRVKTTNESLNNIKMLKLYSWTEIFSETIKSQRVEELIWLWHRYINGMVNVTTLYFFPAILSAVVFAFYIGTNHYLSLDMAFTISTLLNMIKDPMRTLPMFTGSMLEFLVSMRRIQAFLLVDEINPSIISRVNREETPYSIEIKKGSNFHWGVKKDDDKKEKKGEKKETVKDEKEKKKEPLLEETKKSFDDFLVLKELNVGIKQGEFVCIVGDVGSGKSSFLMSLVGDLLYASPEFAERMRANGSEWSTAELGSQLLKHSLKPVPDSDAPILISEDMALVQQTPWILNKSIRENILFGHEYDEAKFKECIKICQLRRDLDILPGGDLTEIGEKGINLSGGQKARVGLARSVYADRDLILMDDPISALDANVKKKIFKSVFMKKFARKTRILVTHAIDFLHLVDTIILVKDGRIVLHGPFHEVKENAYLKELVRIFKSHQKE